MPRGGHAASGPPPDPNSLRSARAVERGGWTTLPAAGREGVPPVWPLTEPSVREFDLWVDLWGRPQAVAWEQLGQELEVALFVRTLAEVEAPGASTERRKALRGYLDSLGLSVAGMLRNRWRVAAAEAEPEPVRSGAGGEQSRRSSARDRLRVVSDGEGA